MQKMKRALALFVLMVFIIVSTMSGFALPLDLAGHWAEEPLQKWSDNGLIEGYVDGSIKPDNPIRRSEFATFLNRIFKFIESSQNIFSDVKEDGWYKEAVLKAYEAGVVQGYPGDVFMPDNKITRQEAVVMVGRAFEMKAKNNESFKAFSDSKNVKDWASDYVSALYEEGYIKGRGNNQFAPEAYITRAEAVTIFSNIMKEIVQKAGKVESKTIKGNLVVNSANVTLKDLKIEGDLYLTQGIGEGEVTLDRVTVEGKTVVKGGGENSIVLNNTSLNDLIVIKKNGKVKILSTGNTKVLDVSAQSGAKLNGKGFRNVELIKIPSGQSIQLDGDFESVKLNAQSVNVAVVGGKVGSFEVGANANDANFSVTSGIVSNLSVKAKSKVDLKGGFISNLNIGSTASNSNVNVLGTTVNSLKVDTNASILMSAGIVNKVEVSSKATNSSLTVNGATVNEIETAAKVSIDIKKGKVETVDIKATAGESNILIASEAEFSKLQTDAKISVTGKGAPGTAIIKANGVVMETKPDVVNIVGDVSAQIEGNSVSDANDDSDTVGDNEDPDDMEEPEQTTTSPSPSTTSPSPSVSLSPSQQPSVIPSVNPSPSPAKLDISYTAISIMTSGDEAEDIPDTNGQAVLDLTATNDLDLIQQINLTTNATELYVTSLLTENMGTMLIQEAITGNLNNITIQDLLGSGNTDLTIGNLRRFIGNSMTINAILKKGSDYNNKSIAITINLPTGELQDSYENEYIMATSSGKTITATVKDNKQNTRVASIGIINTISNIFGQLPKSVSINGETWYTPTTDPSVANDSIKAAIAELASTGLDTKSWETVTLQDLVGKRMYFKKVLSGETYTLVIVPENDRFYLTVDVDDKIIKAKMKDGADISKLAGIGAVNLISLLANDAPEEFSIDELNWRVVETQVSDIESDLVSLTGITWDNINLGHLANKSMYVKYDGIKYTLNMTYGEIILPTSKYAGNPIVSHKYTADPATIVANDRLYVFCSHDLDYQTDYDIIDYTLVSSDDLVNWTDHGEVFKVPDDASWATKAYAPDCIYRNGKYYLYFPDGGDRIGVAVSDNITGPFVDVLGEPLVDRDMPNCDVTWCFDPGVFIDDDGQAYLYFGGGGPGNARVIKLNEDMISTEGEAVTIDAPEYFEAPYMHKYNGKYYFSYSTNWDTTAARIDYMMSDNPMTGFEHVGTILDNPPDNNSNNNHAAIVNYKGNWYVVYHNRKQAKIDGVEETYHRSINIDRMYYNEDGTIKKVVPSTKGPEQLKCVDPFSNIEAESIESQSGIETGVCSEGGINITSLTNNDWTKYSGINFYNSANGFLARVASNSGSGQIEIRLDSLTGTLVGTCNVSATGGNQTWTTVSCDTTAITGVHDIYLKYKGSGELFNLNWFKFTN